MADYPVPKALYLEDDNEQDWTKFVKVIVGGGSLDTSVLIGEPTKKIQVDAKETTILDDTVRSDDAVVANVADNCKEKVTSKTAGPVDEAVKIDATIESKKCEPKVFLVYETAFRQQSPFFEAALSHDFKEAQEGIIRLPEHEPEVFTVYLHWVMGHRIRIPSRDTGHQAEPTCGLLVRAYVLGDVLQDVDFKDAVTDSLLHFCLVANWIPSGEFEFLWENTTKGAGIQRVMLGLIVDNKASRLVTCKDFSGGGVEFFKDLVKRMHMSYENGNRHIPYNEAMKEPRLIVESEEYVETCCYHEHRPNECYIDKYEPKAPSTRPQQPEAWSQ